MKRHVWAKPELTWVGFEPRAYVLAAEKVWGLPLTRSSSTGGESQTTLGELFSEFTHKTVRIEGGPSTTVICSDSTEVVVSGVYFHRELLALLFQLKAKGLSFHDVLWYYYDSDACRTEPQESYTFFLVAGDNIIDEAVPLFDWPQYGFDPSILVAASHSDSIWLSDPEWDAANDRFWYRKFYTETRTGQLMVLRPDEPQLYYYPEGRYKANSGLDVTNTWLAEIRRLLAWIRVGIWTLLVLAAVYLLLL